MSQHATNAAFLAVAYSDYMLSTRIAAEQCRHSPTLLHHRQSIGARRLTHPSSIYHPLRKFEQGNSKAKLQLQQNTIGTVSPTKSPSCGYLDLRQMSFSAAQRGGTNRDPTLIWFVDGSYTMVYVWVQWYLRRRRWHIPKQRKNCSLRP